MNDNQNKKLEKNIENTEINEHQVRVDKVKKLRQMGIEPWPETEQVTATLQEVTQNYDPDVTQRYSIAGRVLTLRTHGKTAFAHIQDMTGKLQVYFKQDLIGEKAFDLLKNYIDIGDIIWCLGETFKTKTGEITLKIKEFKLLSKSLYPLPEKFHGLTDIEKKYRQRYLDLIVNPETRQRFIKRTEIINNIRNFLNEREYIEVETPMLHPIAGGAAAKPFVTHHNALATDFYLRIAPELYLKRLVIGGFEKVYEINRNFRNEGISTKHNPEFTMLEFYTAYKDYHYSMDLVEEMLKSLAFCVNKNLQLNYGDHVIDFEKPFVRLTVKEAVKEYGNLSDNDLNKENIDKTLNKFKVKAENKNASVGEKIFTLFEEVAESKLIQPTFITDFPVEVSPLAKKSPENPNIVNRYELFIGGMEISNSFNELNDPFDQAERFKEQLKAFEGGNEEAHQFDEDYILSLEHGLPPTVGVGIGIDRLVMLLTNTTSIKEVILFPTLKPRV